ncbi:hypothetical protein TNIN_131861 [Trichonephila inaurata madagascariensis]|uniref:Uncharacterized protein n=1 Tax=Trichonephila inaurata madagascariensis TaxID=2747483 RepID=A0A8X7CBQ0_9ARAC|nr:hypothetical protein TNIN_131861 [Trichonephila inaurata madagascariensis]
MLQRNRRKQKSGTSKKLEIPCTFHNCLVNGRMKCVIWRRMAIICGTGKNLRKSDFTKQEDSEGRWL